MSETQTFTGPKEAWDTIWETISHDMKSIVFDPALRREIMQAEAQIKEVPRLTPSQDGLLTKGLTMNQIVPGRTYRFRDQATNQKQGVAGLMVQIEKKNRTKVAGILLEDAAKWKKGQSLNIPPNLLEEL